jgi:hypothetical protein
MPDRRDDGQWVSVDPRKVWPQREQILQKTTTLAIPLVEVTGGEQLKARIIDPLVKAIEAGSS